MWGRKSSYLKGRLNFKEHRADVRTPAWSPDGRALWSADVEGNVVVRSLRGGVEPGGR